MDKIALLSIKWKHYIKNYYVEMLFYIVACILFLLLFLKAYASMVATAGSLLFITFIGLAIYFNKATGKKYIFASISYIACFVTLLALPVDFQYIVKFIFFLPVLYAYLLIDPFFSSAAGLGIIYTLYTHHNNVPLEAIFSTSVGMLSSTVCNTIIAHLGKKILKERNLFRQVSITDSLTGLFNLDHMLKTGQFMLETGNEVSMIVIDLDNFKNINDTYGHIKGNQVLAQVAKVLVNEMKDMECCVGRMGGDEFLILILNMPEPQVRAFSRNLEERLEKQLYGVDTFFEQITLPLSMGMAHTLPGLDTTIEELLHTADLDMYYHKYLNQNTAFTRENAYDHDKVRFLSEEHRLFLKVLSEKDMYTYVHSKYTAQIAYEFGQALDLPEYMLTGLYTAGWLHDMGKILISNDILRKSKKLLDEEYNIIKRHVQFALHIISIEDAGDTSEIVLNAIKYHHEHWDGTGYPFELDGASTPLEGRILQLADAYSAMTIKRVYREPMTTEQAMEEIHNKSGSQFDPELTTLFLRFIVKKEGISNINPVLTAG